MKGAQSSILKSQPKVSVVRGGVATRPTQVFPNDLGRGFSNGGLLTHSRSSPWELAEMQSLSPKLLNQRL